MPVNQHPISEDTYELLPDGTVKVRDHRTGVEGVFGPGARWLSGELRFADQQMIQFTIDQARYRAQMAALMAQVSGNDRRP